MLTGNAASGESDNDTGKGNMTGKLSLSCASNTATTTTEKSLKDLGLGNINPKVLLTRSDTDSDFDIRPSGFITKKKTDEKIKGNFKSILYKYAIYA